MVEQLQTIHKVVLILEIQYQDMQGLRRILFFTLFKTMLILFGIISSLTTLPSNPVAENQL